MNRQLFYDSVRVPLFKGRISTRQLAGMEAVLNEWEASSNPNQDLRHLGYMLATDYHETAATMQPIAEFGKGKGHQYGQMLKRSGVAYSFPRVLFYGRGLVQLTWYENYQLMSRLIGVPELLSNPDLALQMDVSVKIMFEGMLRGSSSFGDFTGKCLEMYFNDTTNDPLGARFIINGRKKKTDKYGDKAELIATYHNNFLKGLKLAA